MSKNKTSIKPVISGMLDPWCTATFRVAENYAIIVNVHVDGDITITDSEDDVPDIPIKIWPSINKFIEGIEI